jgi:hypothetical protein
MKTLEDLKHNLKACSLYKIKPLFSMDGLAGQYTNDEIYNYLKPDFPFAELMDFIKNIKRENPTIQNSFMNNPPELNFDDLSGRDWKQYYFTTKSHHTGSIVDKLEEGMKILNRKTNGFFDKLATIFDGKNIVPSGGSVIKSILNNNNRDSDFDIFGTSAGLITLINALRDLYDEFIIFAEYPSVICILIPGQQFVLQFIITDNPISWIIGSKNRSGFDLEHVKFAVMYDEIDEKTRIYCSYNAFKCLKLWQTSQSADIKGCIFPHRLLKAIRMLPFLKTPLMDEYSAHILDNQILDRDLKYIYLNKDNDFLNTDFILRKIYNLPAETVIYRIADMNQIIEKNKEIAILSNDKVIENFMEIVSYEKKMPVQTTNINTLVNPADNPTNPADKPANPTNNPHALNEYENSMRKIQKTGFFNIYTGVIPPVVVHSLYKTNMIVVKPYKPGPISDKVFRGNPYMLLEIENKKHAKPGYVLYCCINNIYSKIQKTVATETGALCLMLIKTSWTIRYQDLE